MEVKNCSTCYWPNCQSRNTSDKSQCLAEHFADCTKEGVVTESGNFIKFTDGTWIDLDPTLELNHAFNLKEGDKVEVIVIKKD